MLESFSLKPKQEALGTRSHRKVSVLSLCLSLSLSVNRNLTSGTSLPDYSRISPIFALSLQMYLSFLEREFELEEEKKSVKTQIDYEG